MTLVFILMAAGAVMLFLEVVLPGGVLGLFAGLAFTAATGFAWSEGGFGAALITALISCVLGLAALIAWAYVLPKTSIGKKMLPKADKVESADSPLKKHIGKTCVARTELTPTGKVALGGEIYDARCISASASKDEALIIVDADFYELKVKPNSRMMDL